MLFDLNPAHDPASRLACKIRQSPNGIVHATPEVHQGASFRFSFQCIHASSFVEYRFIRSILSSLLATTIHSYLSASIGSRVAAFLAG